MNVLYFSEPDPRIGGGVSNVACHLTKVLAKRVNLTCFPRFKVRKGYPVDFFNVYLKFMMREFDVLHSSGIPFWFNGSSMLFRFAKRRRTRTVLSIHDIMPLEHKLEPKLYGPVRSLDLADTIGSCKIADRIVVNSEYMRSKVAVWYGMNLDKIVVIPNGVNLSRFRECNKLTLEGDPVILYLGALTTRKGIDILFQAIAALRSELPNMKLHLVGGGTMLSYFQHLVENRGICRYVVFHGRVPDVMVPIYYKSADFCVFPSRHEPFGIVALEAMASGIPIIASNIGGLGEIITNGQDGLLFKPGDADALSKAILALNKDSDLRRKLSQTALKTVERYSWEVVAEEYASLYKNLCQR